MTPREPRAYRFARHLGRAMASAELVALLGAGFITVAAWSLHVIAGMAVLGVFLLMLAVILGLSQLQQGRSK